MKSERLILISDKSKSERAIKIAQLFLIKVTYFFKIWTFTFFGIKGFSDRFSFLWRPLEYQDQKDQAFQDPFSLSVIDATFPFRRPHFFDQAIFYSISW